MPGVIVGGSCVFGTAAEVAGTYYSRIPPAVTSGPDGYTVLSEVVAVLDGFVLRSTRCGSGGCAVSDFALGVPDLAPCDPLERLQDGLSLGWLIVAVWAAVWAVVVIRRGL